MQAALARIAQAKQHVALLIVILIHSHQESLYVIIRRYIAIEHFLFVLGQDMPQQFFQAEQRYAFCPRNSPLEFKLDRLPDIDKRRDLEPQKLSRNWRTDFVRNHILFDDHCLRKPLPSPQFPSYPTV